LRRQTQRIEDLLESIESLKKDVNKLTATVQSLQSAVRSQEASLSEQLKSVREGLDQLNSMAKRTSKDLLQINQHIDDAVHENQERLDMLRSQLESKLSKLQDGLKEEIKASHKSILEKTAEINEGVLTLYSQSTQTLSKLLEESEGIRASIEQMAEGTLAMVRAELSQQAQAEEKRAKELRQCFDTVSDKIYVELSKFMENLKQEFEDMKNEVNKKIDELGGKILAAAYDVATVVAFLEALRNDVNKALDTAVASLDLYCERNLINQILRQQRG